MKKLYYIFLVVGCTQLMACSSTKLISKQAHQFVITDSALATAHVGICIYNATDNKYLYNYQSDKNFIPASNTKIFTCYLAMKYLGDSLVGLRYKKGNNDTLYIEPAGDPSFLHPDFQNQPVFNFLKQFKNIVVSRPFFNDNYEGVGWSWDDYKDDYMVQRNNLPIYGNVMRISQTGNAITIVPVAFKFIIPEGTHLSNGFNIEKGWDDNNIIIKEGKAKHMEVPFVPTIFQSCSLLSDTLHAFVFPDLDNTVDAHTLIIHSQSTDSLLKIMMHRSDNFYAEQSLLMVSNEKLGLMNDEKIIDTLLKTDLKDLPQHPQWVDGSGLSRFNLFSPRDFVFILNKMRNEYSWNRITAIFETGGTGTLGGYYKNLTGKIYAKTGSLSNNIALSGYLITPKNKVLIFSVLVNNHTVSSAAVRRAVERFLTQVQQDY